MPRIRGPLKTTAFFQRESLHRARTGNPGKFPHGWLKIPGFPLRLGGPNGRGFIQKPSARKVTYWSSIPALCGLILDFTWKSGLGHPEAIVSIIQLQKFPCTDQKKEALCQLWHLVRHGSRVERPFFAGSNQCRPSGTIMVKNVTAAGGLITT